MSRDLTPEDWDWASHNIMHTERRFVGCPFCAYPDEPPALATNNTPADLLRTAAENLREGRVLFAETFVKAKAGLLGTKSTPTDELARQMTVAATKDELTVLEAEYEICLARLGE